MNTDNTSSNSSKHTHSNSSRIADESDEKKVKELNREITTVFGIYKASFGHASARIAKCTIIFIRQLYETTSRK